VINYTETPDWDEKARELTDGRGVDCVVEIGRAGHDRNVAEGLGRGRACQADREPVAIGDHARPVIALTGRGITVGAISVGSCGDFEAMNRAIACIALRPVINRTFPFAEAKAAYRHFEGRGHFGKVAIAHG
jgi:NADPH:quinone reductase-like Zn-dependent oxidoreductase